VHAGEGEDIVLRVVGARRSIGQRKLLDGVDLTLRRRLIYALLGPNGAGKTSLLRAISGRLKLDSGSVDVTETDRGGRPWRRQMLGVVPQSIAFYPYLTPRENLEVFGRLMGVTRRQLPDRVAQALELTALAERADDRAGTLSGGLQRRLNIAIGMLHRPAILLLDEPTVGIDPRAREDIHNLLRSLAASGMSVLITTHDLGQASELADQVGILVEGRICAEGAPDALVRDAFGDAKELWVKLSSDPDERGCALLADEGLEPVQGQRTWTGPLGPGMDGLSAMSERMAEARLGVTELRVREPGLRGVFFRVTGQEFDA
jgi:ABC-2 type transport system ATP-binding protein